jgi:cytochrome c peroxidase
MTLARKGEFYFNDAGICFQGWQSCSTCHPGQARVDGLNWDLLNDGIGNPKNTKSMLLAHKTPPAMSMGVRDTAETAVRAGIQHILFTVQPEEVALAIDKYLKSLQPVPSPLLVNGQFSDSARRGEKLFKDRQVGCAACHPPGLFTDLQTYDVGTRGRFDKPTDRFDTPTLVEGWRTAPYLHDGSAATMRDVLTASNPSDKHGKTSQLTPQQIDDLAAYLLSL